MIRFSPLALGVAFGLARTILAGVSGVGPMLLARMVERSNFTPLDFAFTGTFLSFQVIGNFVGGFLAGLLFALIYNKLAYRRAASEDAVRSSA